MKLASELDAVLIRHRARHAWWRALQAISAAPHGSFVAYYRAQARLRRANALLARCKGQR